MQEKLVAFSAITIKDTAEMLVKKFLDTEKRGSNPFGAGD